MSAVPLKDDLLNVAKLFGDVDTVVSDAVRRYAIDRCVERIEFARGKILDYEKEYGVSYKIFSRKIQTDEKFLKRAEFRHVSWEEDAIEWKYRTEEIEEWTKTLESILKQ